MAWWNPFDGPDVGDNVEDFGYSPIPNRPNFGGGNFMGPGMGNPFTLGQGIQAIAAGRQIPGQEAMANDREPGALSQIGDEPGAFSQIGHAITGVARGAAGIPGKVLGAAKGAVGWDSMEGMDKAQLMGSLIGGGFDIWSQYKQGKEEDEERRKRQRSAEALRPYIQAMMASSNR